MSKKKSVWEEAMDWDPHDLDKPGEPAQPGGQSTQMPRPQKTGAPKYTPGVSRPDSPMRGRAMSKPQKTEGPTLGGQQWIVDTGDGGPGYPVTAASDSEAKRKVQMWLSKRGERVNPSLMKAQPQDAGPPRAVAQRAPTQPVESTTGGSGAGGYQTPIETTKEKLREMIRAALKEIVRKKEGGGGYRLYGPNKGKKKNPKPAGEFPTRLAAKRAELARFPPKDPDQLKKMRKRIEKLNKDPKKRADADRKDLTGAKTIKKVGKAAGERKKAKRESLVSSMVDQLSERLFRDEDIAGSPWDDRLANLHPDHVSADKRLAALHKAMHGGSTKALDAAHKGLSKSLRGMAKVQPGEISMDDNRQKMFMPVMLDVDGNEIGPIHLYVDGGNVKCELSQEARDAIAELDPPISRDLRGGLMSFQEDHLPTVDHARGPWDDRDSYLDKLHGKLDNTIKKLSPIEIHLAKQMLHRRRK